MALPNNGSEFCYLPYSSCDNSERRSFSNRKFRTEFSCMYLSHPLYLVFNYAEGAFEVVGDFAGSGCQNHFFVEVNGDYRFESQKMWYESYRMITNCDSQ